jgi:hypothetical protein
MITITKTPAGYTCTATPPEAQTSWSTDTPEAVERIINELRDRGAHQSDIGDAFYLADPDWLEELKRQK